MLHLVEGDNGFFCLLHDDVALEPDAIGLLVEELYRSNAGIVGPKLVDWDDVRHLQHVGLGVDRFGEIDPLVEPGELDQEQHDAVRDVFALPSACMLIRADLFRTLGGFDPALRFYGDDVDLCWRAHLGGARVVVVPSARARHRERLPERRPDLRPVSMQARHRMRAVATLTGTRRLAWVLLQLIVITLAEMVVGLLTARPRQALGVGAGAVRARAADPGDHRPPPPDRTAAPRPGQRGGRPAGARQRPAGVVHAIARPPSARPRGHHRAPLAADRRVGAGDRLDRRCWRSRSSPPAA